MEQDGQDRAGRGPMGPTAQNPVLRRSFRRSFTWRNAPWRWSGLRGPFWVMGAILLLSALLSAFLAQSSGPSYEAQAVVQVRQDATPEEPTVPAILATLDASLLSRDALIAMAQRHGLTGEAAAADLLQAVSFHPLTSAAGATLGLGPKVSGIVISVRLGTPDLAVRIANDLALQVLDLGQGGLLDPGHDLLLFYRGEEARLWQEVAALRSEVAPAAPDQAAPDQATPDQPAPDLARRLMLLEDQYALIRQDLAAAEIAARLAQRQRSSQFGLMQRATVGTVVQLGPLWPLLALLGLGLLAGALVMPARRTGARSGLASAYLMVDDPDPPIWALPRFAVVSAGLLAGLVLLSVWLH